MAPKSSNINTYKDGVELDLERLKKNEQRNTNSEGIFN